MVKKSVSRCSRRSRRCIEQGRRYPGLLPWTPPLLQGPEGRPLHGHVARDVDRQVSAEQGQAPVRRLSGCPVQTV